MTRAIWKVAPGTSAWVWDLCRENGCITINWLNNKDLSQFPEKRDITRELVRISPREGSRGATSIWPFVHEIRQDDVIVANDGLSRVVGIGVVVSGYLPPGHPRNPGVGRDHNRHARLVDWVVDQPVDLGRRLFNQPTVQRLGREEWLAIVKAYRRTDPRLAKSAEALLDPGAQRAKMGPEADESADIPESEYMVTGGDQREAVWRQIKQRRGQPEFRRVLLRRYDSRCVVTGCTVVGVLEAAHIDPYRGAGHNHPANGLLLRADVHTLFDLDLLGIDPATLSIQLHPDIAKTYSNLVQKRLGCSRAQRPHREALRRRYDLFTKRSSKPV